MGDLRNKYGQAFEEGQSRLGKARRTVPQGRPFEPACAGCGLKDFNNPSPKGFGVIRFYSVSGAWQELDKIYCEDCLEAHTGEKPHGD